MTTNDIDIEVITEHDIALLIKVDREGVADVRAPYVTKRQAAGWMRHLADEFDRQADAEEAAS